MDYVNELVTIETQTKIRNRTYCRLRVYNVENEIFNQLISIFKKHHGLYLAEVKRWFIEDKYIDDVINEIKPLAEQAHEISTIRQELLKKTNQDNIEKLITNMGSL